MHLGVIVAAGGRRGSRRYGSADTGGRIVGFREIFQTLIVGSAAGIYAAGCDHRSAVSGADVCLAIVKATEIAWIARSR